MKRRKNKQKRSGITTIRPRTRGATLTLIYGRTNGKTKLCCLCGKPVPPQRRNWCSAACVQAYRMDSDWKYAKQQAIKRDAWTCQICRCLVYLKGRKDAPALAEVDHIVRVADGGTNAQDNLRTTCIRCHEQRHKSAPPFINRPKVK